MSAISADYKTNKHIPSRKCYQLILEVAEEEFPNVCNVLGYPKTGENTYVGIALLDKAIVRENRTTEQSEGERLRTRAVLLCKDAAFQEYISTFHIKYMDGLKYSISEDGAIQAIYDNCDITSRSELSHNRNAQDSFNILLRNFREWKTSQQYADNLSRT